MAEVFECEAGRNSSQLRKWVILISFGVKKTFVGENGGFETCEHMQKKKRKRSFSDFARMLDRRKFGIGAAAIRNQFRTKISLDRDIKG